MKPVRFGFIGCGLMGRELATASLRWPHLLGDLPRPVIVAACDTSEENLNWFRKIPTVHAFYRDYRELLQNPEIEAVYCALPHALHAKVYRDIILSGKHLLGEKPFGMDLSAFETIQSAMQQRPDIFVRCSSEFPYYPAVQQIVRWFQAGAFGQVIEARFAIKHSSDMDLKKPINWKRQRDKNGDYGCMGDLGIHTQHLPFRLGLLPHMVGAQLANLVKTRPGPNGAPVPCETWDNAVLSCEGHDQNGDVFPMVFEMKRMAPGCTNTVEYEIDGINLSARFTTDDPNAVYFTQSMGQKQAWTRLVVGQAPLFPVITGGIFEFGFSDSILQMLAAFTSELRGLPCAFPCFTPDEAHKSHLLLTAALQSYNEKRMVPLSLD